MLCPMAPPLHSNYTFPATNGRPPKNSSSCDYKDGKEFPRNIRQRVASSFSSSPTKTLAWFQQKISSSKKPNAGKNRRTSEGDQFNTDHHMVNAKELRSSRTRTFSPRIDRRRSLAGKKPCVEEGHYLDSCLNCGASFLSQPSINLPLGRTPMRKQHGCFVNSPTLFEIASPEPEEQSDVFSQDSYQPAPPIPWETRPKPQRPFRPIGEYDADIAMLNSPGRVQSFPQGSRPRPTSKSSLAMPAHRPAALAYTTRSNSYSFPSDETNRFTSLNPRRDSAFGPSGRVGTARENSFYSVASLPTVRRVHLEPRSQRCSSLTVTRSGIFPHSSCK